MVAGKSTIPDLFSTASTGERDAPSAGASRNAPSTDKAPRHVLPKDLANAVKHLTDPEFERLVSAVIAEQKRRGKPAVGAGTSTGPRKEDLTPLTTGTVKLVRAAFKAGVTPLQIARQFGMSRADVQRALSSQAADQERDA
jgi:hypothetical protein